MKKIVLILFTVILCTSLLTSAATDLPFDGKYINKNGLFATEIGLSARNIALGRAFSGVADDYTAVYFNPAGIGFANEIQFGISYSYLIADARFAAGTIDFPLNDLFSFAVSYNSRFFNSPFQGRNEFGMETHKFGYFEGSALIGTSFEILNHEKLGRISTGINVKLINTKIDTIGEFGFGVDGGILWDIPVIKSRWGISFQNIVAPVMNYKDTDNSYPRIMKTGISTTVLKNFLFTAEAELLDFTSGNSSVFNIMAGAQWSPLRYLSLQAGGNLNEISAGITGHIYGFDLGYAFTLMPNKSYDQVYKHFISINYKLGYTESRHEKELTQREGELQYDREKLAFNQSLSNENFTKAVKHIRNMIANRKKYTRNIPNKLKILLNETKLKVKAENLYEKALQYYNDEDYSNAAVTIQEVYKINPDYQKGNALKEKIFNHQKVIDKLKQARELYDKNKYEKSYAILEDCLQLEPENEAVQELNELLKPHINEKLALDITENARTFFKVGDYEKALQLTTEALELFPNCYPATELKAEIINGKARRIYNKAYEKYKNEKYNEALQYIEDFNRIENSGKKFRELKDMAHKLYKLASGKKMLSMAKTEIERENFKKAEEYIKKAISFDPDNQVIKETYERIKQMKDIMGD